ncbi:EamA family transporter RarD [Lapillicoccus jejuensis]|uniref:Chloramphenicol-sensitive protein RarD n=1 Tax=Lapillicoccus jejuensis TaxID=402171 RepID=A0A542DX14_9MICO|nr:EamA family transporter RarD [Lapillicoccus jejuensis]TQJ07627.1 chloramphenicol-sensitive protein RarD [Lapillicoccus jejuensis]
MSAPDEPRDEVARGAAYGLLAYGVWGVFPLYFHALQPAGPVEVLAHRIVWTLLVCVAVLLVRRDLAWVGPLLRRPRLLGGLALAAVAIAVNWGVYVGAVVSDNVADASLGYFLNPLVTVALGVLLLGERLRRLQWAAVVVGLVAGIYLSVAGGHLPWVSFVLAASFASYGLLKKRLGAELPALHGLTVETVVLAPFATVALVVLGVTGQQTFTHDGGLHAVLLVLGGVVTAVPLLLFASAARRVPLVTIGLLQFVTPVLQLLCGVLLLDEHLSPARWFGFGIVWVALVLLTLDSFLARPRRGRGGPEPAPVV